MLQKPKGTYDVYGTYGKNLLYVEDTIKKLIRNYNYDYIRTPHFEASELFHRTVGEDTDIVSKETYDFLDRGNRQMTLRPEGTAGVVRSLIENKLYAEKPLPIKVWYYGSMFRYERPQAGRFREFTQFGVEAFGSKSPMLDAEVISIPVNLYKSLGLKGLKVKINALGDSESRNKYKEALKEYFKPYLADLGSDCKVRYEKNILRILDCKVDRDMDIFKTIPKISSYLNEESINYFNDVKAYLETMNFAYEVDENLVRGLDYYTGMVFEISADIASFGSNNVLCGGGRYDKLVGNLGGPDMEGVGFGIGVERLMLALEAENLMPDLDDGTDIYIIPLSTNQNKYALALNNLFRNNNLKSEIDYLERSIKANFKQADKLKAKFVLLIGEEEEKTSVLTLKNNLTQEEYKVEKSNVLDFVSERI
jgi:histidyl-tRNA synthetase